MIIYREKLLDEKGIPILKEYNYKNSKGEVIKDKNILNYIESLVIPPAYDNVKIFYEKNPKILYEGYDNKERKQQIYSPKWRARADKEKFKDLYEFGLILPKLNNIIEKNIQKLQKNIKQSKQYKIVEKELVISFIIKIIKICHFRVGNSKYHRLYGSYGMVTLQNQHVKLLNDKISIRFRGKKGVINQCYISYNDYPEIKNIFEFLKKINKDNLFTYLQNEKGKNITADDINEWLQNQHPKLTTKMFRTFDTNIYLINFLKYGQVISSCNNLCLSNIENNKDFLEPEKMTETQRKKNIVQSMKLISDCVNNTSTICKKSYANKDIINMYINNPKKYKKMFINNKSAEENFLNFLK